MAARIFFSVVVLFVSVYTLSYMSWLWRKKKKKEAIGVLILALTGVIYPIFVAFFIWVKDG